MRIWWIFMGIITPVYGFLWTLFGGGNNCNCCQCSAAAPSPPRFPAHPNFFASPTLVPQFQNSYSYSYSPPAPPAPPAPSYSIPPPDLITTTDNYRGPPAAAPISQEQLDNERKYATNQVVYHSESRPVTTSEYGDQSLTQLEEELAAEKYKYNQKQKEKEEKKKQGKIKVFKIKPHKSSRVSIGMVEWQASQVAKLIPDTNEKAVDKFIEATSDANEVGNDNESLEEFIPIEIGSEPEYADEEPAGPPPNVRNRISHDPVLVNSIVNRRRFIL
ncbi:unnamed protein product [Caenorhabditis nigoni]